jgi:hypothetical protein
MPSTAEQTTDQLRGAGSLLARQRRDHEHLDRLLAQLAPTRGPEQDETLTRLWRLVFLTRTPKRPSCGR